MHLVCIWFASGKERIADHETDGGRRSATVVSPVGENVSDDDLTNGYVRSRATGNHAYYVCQGTPRKWRKVAIWPALRR